MFPNQKAAKTWIMLLRLFESLPKETLGHRVLKPLKQIDCLEKYQQLPEPRLEWNMTRSQ